VSPSEKLVGEADAPRLRAQQSSEQREQRALAAARWSADAGDAVRDLGARAQVEVAAAKLAVKGQHAIDIRGAFPRAD